ncbi:MAG: PhoH family protein [Deltaproteobacteria bacterium]|nr:PhoH family protein [Deltaproteobacteria bacterium]
MFNKCFVLDTSAIISLVQDVTTFRGSGSPAFAGVLGDNEIVIPRVVLDELHALTREDGEIAVIASEAARQLEQYSTLGSLLEGVETEKGGLLRVAPRPKTEKVVAWGLKANVADHEILATTLEEETRVRREMEADVSEGEVEGGGGAEGDTALKPETAVRLISQDRILRVLARSVYGVVSEELKSICAPDASDDPGCKVISVSSSSLDEIMNCGYYEMREMPRMNQFFHIVDRENPDVRYCYAISAEPGSKRAHLIDRAKVDYLKVAGEVTGRNVRQKLLLWALMGCGEPDPNASGGIRLITVSGPAGSGKSFLVLAAAWERLERGQFERIVVTRPMVDVGTSLGFLPGTLEEKVRPWGGPIEDNLRAIVQVPSPNEGRGGKRGFQKGERPFDAKAWLEMENRLELVPMTYIRGRTFRNSFVILEEAQNLERGPLKVLLTRLGEGSVVVVVGDLSQIDNQFLSKRNNGLIHAINAFRNWPQAIHVHLRDIVRSDLAQAASELL